MDPRSSLKTVRHSEAMPECWAPSKTLRPQTSAAESRTPSLTLRPQTAAADLRAASSSRLHTAAGDLRDLSRTAGSLTIPLHSERSTVKSNGSIFRMDQKHGTTGSSGPKNGTINNSASDHSGTFSYKRLSGMNTDPAPVKRLQSVKSYSSPPLSLEGFSPLESPKQSVFDARSLKHPEFDIESCKYGPQKSRVKHTNDVFDPSLNIRSPSINGDFKVDIGPTESLVTEMPLPPPEPTVPSTESTSPSEASRRLRRKIEAALRMYPRNTWGPITKWRYQDEPTGKHHEKGHFIKDHDKLEKQRLESRRFGHQRHWVKFKDVTNLWEQEDARQSQSYVTEKEQFLADSEKMLHAQNDKRISRAKCIDEALRVKKRWREFKRLEKRESEYINKRESDQRHREDPGTKVNDSAVVYNIVNLEYPNNYTGDLLRFEDAQIRWRQCMRALRIQSKQSGSHLYNVLSWKPTKPCCVPPIKPVAPEPPDPKLLPSPRKPELPLPKNMLHLTETCEDVPVGCTNDNRTNW